MTTVKRFALVGSVVSVLGVIIAVVNLGLAGAAGNSFVQIANTTTQPVPVREVEKPWQMQLSLPTNASALAGTTSASLVAPSGEELTIEFVSSPAFATNQNYSMETTSLTTTVGGVTVTHYLNVNPPYNQADLSQLIRIHGDPGTTVTVTATYNGGQQASAIPISLSGYVTPAPQ